MPPAKSRTGYDDSSKPDAAHAGSKDGHARDKDGQNGSLLASNHVHTNGGKMRRVTSAAGTNLRESVTADAVPTAASGPGAPASSAATASGTAAHEDGAQGATIQWSSFDRSVLHSYRRVYRLNTPTSFMTDYHRWVLSRPGSIGLQSPTMLRSKVFRRQGKDQLAGAVRQHFNSQGIQENDVIVDFLHKVHTTTSGAVSKHGRTRRKEPQS